jgi:hypothetical protein
MRVTSKHSSCLLAVTTTTITGDDNAFSGVVGEPPWHTEVYVDAADCCC